MTRVRTLCVTALGMLLVLSLGACSLAPKYERETFDMPSEWRKVTIHSTPLYTDWWKRFNDPVLNDLVAEALKNNQDLSESLARIDSAAAQAGVATSALFPAVDGSAGAGAQSMSERTANYSNLANRAYTTYQGALSAAWELDFWGKYRNQRTMLTDVLMNTLISHEALRLSVASQTAQSYFALLALDMQLATADRTLKSREESFAIYTSRYQQGDITELDWQRARAEVETARSQLHSAIVAVDSAEASLAVLLGRSPREILEGRIRRGKAIESMPSPPVLPEGLPSDLLMRRPDVRASEFLVMAYNANIGVARAQFFPSISITGALGTLSASFGHLFTNSSGTWNYGATASVPLLDFGRNWYNLKDAEAQKKAAIATYRKTVASAFSDVRTAFTAQYEANAIVNSYMTQVKSLRRSVEIARLQYDNGYSDYLTVLDAERQLFSAELSLANALRDRLNAVVSVCMALGGGWQDPGVTPGPVLVDTEALKEAQRTAGPATPATDATPAPRPASR
ncbi:TolC family protein [uncultured Desulfovibrio sp.]|uniref:efflux transporter outer membrane subunit n=1 Tax=uncultured Desulfovibrio sp. TaxID=167968 RepID=UPI00262F92EE|nr:TolC family protein [uncultured Desulfovibrio sp.]